MAKVLKRSWHSDPVAIGLLRLADCSAVAASGILAYALRFWGALDQIEYAETYALATGLLLVANVFHFMGLYGAGRVRSVPQAPGRLALAWTLVVLLLLGLGFATKTGYQTSRVWVGSGSSSVCSACCSSGPCSASWSDTGKVPVA